MFSHSKIVSYVVIYKIINNYLFLFKANSSISSRLFAMKKENKVLLFKKNYYLIK